MTKQTTWLKPFAALLLSSALVGPLAAQSLSIRNAVDETVEGDTSLVEPQRAGAEAAPRSLDGALQVDPLEALIPQVETALAEHAEAFELALDLSPGALERIYKANDMRPLWADGAGGWRADATPTLATIADAASHGLQAAEFQLDGLDALAATEGMAYDLALTAMLTRYAHVMDQGRFPQRSSYTPYELMIRRGGLEAEDRNAWLNSRMPGTLAYERLRESLLEMRIAADGNSRPHLPEGALLRPGNSDPQVAILREIMLYTGDLRPQDDMSWRVLEGSDEVVAPDFYDPELAAAVRTFQARNGLGVDALVGQNTRRFLNAGPNQMLALIEVNLERLRWEEELDSDKWIRVNIPAYELTTYEAGQSIGEVMTVIVGRQSRPTPLMSDYVVNLKFAPDWTIPTRIAVEDYAPIMRRDPSYAARSGLEVYAAGQQISPNAINWENTELVSSLTLRKPPGANGPLGGVRFSLTNDQAIFLHDTNLPELFAHDDRDLSSGCVRVSDPEGLVSFIVGDAMSSSEIRGRMQSGETSWREVNNPVRVYLSYMTVWVDESGLLRQARDPYGLDAELLDSFAENRAENS